MRVLELMRRPVFQTGLLFALLVALAAGLRLSRISDMEWNYDEKLAVQMADELLAGGWHRLLVGMGSSIGVPNPPGFIVIVAAFRFMSLSPVGVAVAFAVMNVMAIILFAWCFRERLGPWVSWTAAFLYASAPWAVIFSRKIWAQDLLAPFLVCLLVGLDKAIFGRRPASWLLVVASAFVMLQIHFSSIFVLIALPVLVFIYRRQLTRLDYMYIFSAGFVATLMFAPFVAVIFRNIGSVLDCVRASRVESMTFGLKLHDTFAALIQAGTGLFYESTLFSDYAGFVEYAGIFSVATVNSIYVLMAVALCIGIAVIIVKMAREHIFRIAGTLFGAHALFILAFSSRTGLSYYAVMFPVIFLALSCALSLLRSRWIRISLSAACVLVNVYWTVAFQSFIRNNHGSSTGYGVPYSYQQEKSSQ